MPPSYGYHRAFARSQLPDAARIGLRLHPMVRERAIAHLRNEGAATDHGRDDQASGIEPAVPANKWTEITLHWLTFILPLWTLSLAAVAAAQDSGVVCRQQFKTTNNCYHLFKPADAARGLVVLLPYYGSNANEFSSADLPRLLVQKNVAVMAVSASGYLTDDDLVTLRGLIGEVVRKLNIPSGHFVIGGISAGGTGAVRYAEYCMAGRCDARSTPVGVFSVDAPLDFEAWWNRETLNLRRGNPKSSLEESQAILSALRSALGGSPNQARQVYRSRSPFLVSAKDGGNARLLKNLPIRLYTEPDVVWMIDNIGRDYYTMNAADQAALVLQLRVLGNRKAELITTTGRGFRPPGTRNPHSWTIVDEPDLAGWIAGSL